MVLEVNFSASNNELAVDFESTNNVSDGGYEKGYEQGYEDGYKEASSDNYYDVFWDNYQQNGERTSYSYAFYGTEWNNKSFKPKYDITIVGRNQNYIFTKLDIENLKQLLLDLGITIDTSGYINGSYLFQNARVTHVPILDLTNAVQTPSFNNCTKLVEAGFKNITEKCSWNSIDYTGCEALEDFSIEGVIAGNVNFQYCKKLSSDSAKNILTCYKNYYGTDEQDTYTIRFHANVWTRLREEGNTSPNGTTWEQYALDKGLLI